MKLLSSMRRQRSLLNCAPISARELADRAMRSAISRADGSAEFVHQQNFDRAVARLNETGHLYELDGAIWFKSTAFGDEKGLGYPS